MNQTTLLDEIEVRDLEDGSKLRVVVEECSELGNNSKPGLQVHFLGYIVNFEPLIAERWNYQAKKAGGGPLLLDTSWTYHADQFIKVYFVPGAPTPKARVEVKGRTTDQPVTREYDLPFAF